MENSVKEILAREQKRVESRKAEVIEQMKKLGAGAIIWGENIFGSTSYPVLADAKGENRSVCGLYITVQGFLEALTKYPGDKEINDVRILSPEQALAVVSGDMTETGDSPEEWSILCDCFEVAVQMLKAEKIQSEPKPWW